MKFHVIVGTDLSNKGLSLSTPYNTLDSNGLLTSPTNFRAEPAIRILESQSTELTETMEVDNSTTEIAFQTKQEDIVEIKEEEKKPNKKIKHGRNKEV